MRGSSLSDLPDWGRALLDSARVAHLGLLDEQGYPRVQPITFVAHEGALWSAIDDKPKRRTPKRIQRLQTDPRAAITVDRYDDDWARLAWVQAVGRVAVIAIEGHERIIDQLTNRYPAYRDMSPKGPLLRLSPELVIWWSASG
jgi:PPOX class probable F420-dependent enzyme